MGSSRPCRRRRLCQLVEEASLVIDYSNGTASTILGPIMKEMGARVVALNAAVEETRAQATAEGARNRPGPDGVDSAAVGATLGVRIDPSGERIWFITGDGEMLPGMTALAAMAELVLRANPGATIAVPVSASACSTDAPKQYGGQVFAPRSTHDRMMESPPGVRW